MFKRIRIILLICILLISFKNSSYALSNTLTINSKYDGITYNIYKVADILENDYVVTDSFKKYKVDITSLNRELADTLSSYALKDKISCLSNISNNNIVTFKNLSNGIYLINGNTKSLGNNKYTPIPILIDLSKYNSVNMKFDISDNSNSTETTDYTIIKKWYNDNEKIRPTNITIDLLRDGNYYSSYVLSKDNNWSILLDNLSNNYYWSVIERDVPNNYQVLIERNNSEFIINNTYAYDNDSNTNIDKPETPVDKTDNNPSETPNEDKDTSSSNLVKIPQTGQNWIIPMLFVSIGLLLLLVSKLLDKRKNKV